MSKSDPKNGLKTSTTGSDRYPEHQQEKIKELKRESMRESYSSSKRDSYMESLKDPYSGSKRGSYAESMRNSGSNSNRASKTVSLKDSYTSSKKESHQSTVNSKNESLSVPKRDTTIKKSQKIKNENLDEKSGSNNKMIMNKGSTHSVKILSPPYIPRNLEGRIVKKLSRDSSITDITRVKVSQSRLQLSILCFGLILTTMLAGADETIVSTALGSITNEFRQAGDLTWVAGAYLLTATAFQPLYGKFSDIFGRGIVMSIAIGLFAVGSVGCGSASNLTTLIIFRGVAGIGSGGLEALSYIIVADATPLEQRSLYMSLINVTFSVANIFGPLIGGIFVDYLSWRWAFYINIPIAAVAIVIMIFLLPVPKVRGGLRGKLARIDFMGTFTLVLGILLLVLAINWGGVEYPWQSAPVVSCLIIGIMVIICFLFIEWKFAKEPIIPFHVFKKNVIYANLATVCNGMILSTFVYYWPMYHQIIHSSPATVSGLQTLPVLLGDSFFAALSGLISHRTGTYCWMMRLGMVLMLLGVLILSLIQRDYSGVEEVFYPLIIGVGLGLNTQTALVASQAAVPEDDLAVVTALATFSLSIGGVFGLAIVGAVFDNVLLASLTQNLPNVDIKKIIDNHEMLKKLTPAAFKIATGSYLTAYRALFTTLLPFITFGLIATLMMRHTPLVSSKNIQKSKCNAPLPYRHPRSTVLPLDSDSNNDVTEKLPHN